MPFTIDSNETPDESSEKHVDNHFLTFSKEMKRTIDYNIILNLEPTFWISSCYKRSVDSLNEISGCGMRKIQGEYTFANVNGVVVLLLDGKLSIVSESAYNKNYTFFFIAWGNPTQNGRIFNSYTKEYILGFDNGNIVFHLDTSIYKGLNDGKRKIIVARNNGGVITFLVDNSIKVNKKKIDKEKEDFGKINIGLPQFNKRKVIYGFMYETICFNVALTDRQIFRILNILRYYYPIEESEVRTKLEQSSK